MKACKEAIYTFNYKQIIVGGTETGRQTQGQSGFADEGLE